MPRHNNDASSDGSSSSSEDERERRKRNRKQKAREHTRKPEQEKEHSKKKKHRKRAESNKREKAKRRRHVSDDSDETYSSSDDSIKKKKRRLLRQAKEILKKHKQGGDWSPTRDDPEKNSNYGRHKELAEDDYYEKNKEFSTWLKEEQGIYFSSLSSDDTRRLFRDFVEAWNAGKLYKKYYEGVDSATRTNHKWEFKKEQEQVIDREEELEFMKKMEKHQRKRFHKEHEEHMDELLPKATGKDRLFEKAAIRRQEARRREESPELYKERDIMGGGDDFKQRLEREQARRQKKAVERTEMLKEKQQAFEEKEAAAMDQLRALVNVAGGKISIPKRAA